MIAPLDPEQTLVAVQAVAAWILDEDVPEPSRPSIAAAVRLTARTLPQIAPGFSVEVRVPPFVAVQCINGPRHRRGTPPNVVETDSRTWLRLACGNLTFASAATSGIIYSYGALADKVAELLPITPFKIR